MAYERESLIEKHLTPAVKAAGGVAYKFVSPGRRSVPDRIVLLPGGRIVFVECKSPGKAPRADQLREHERLRALGFNGVQLMYNSGAVLLGMVYNFLPFMVFPIYTLLSKMDYRLTEAAADLGCNNWQTLWKVTMPLSIPGIVSGITMVFMPSVTTFFIPRVLGGGNTMMFGDLIEAKFLTEGNWNVGSALSLIMMVLILISLSILRKADPNGEGGGIA